MPTSKSADKDNGAMVVDKRRKSIGEENNHSSAKAFSTRDESLKSIRRPELFLSRDTQKDTVAQNAPSEASRTHLRSQPHLSTESRSKAFGTAGIWQDTKLDIANDMAIDPQEITTAENLQEKNDESAYTRKTDDLSLPQGTQPSTSTMTLISTSTARQPLLVLVLNAASSLPLPSASSLPNNSNASRAAPVFARLPGRVEASPLPAGRYTQRQLEAHARSKKSQSQSQQPAISDVEDVPSTEDIAVDVPPTSHRQLPPQSQRRPHRWGNARPDLIPAPRLTARPNLGQRQRTIPTPLPLWPAQPRPGCVLIYATFTTPAGQIFLLSALNAQLNPIRAAVQAGEEVRIRRYNDLSLPGRLAEMEKMHETERQRQRVREQRLAAYEADRLWVEREAELERAGEGFLDGDRAGGENVEGGGEDDRVGVEEAAEAEGGGVESGFEDAVEDIASAPADERLGLAETQPSWETVLSPLPADKTIRVEGARLGIHYARVLPEEDGLG